MISLPYYPATLERIRPRSRVESTINYMNLLAQSVIARDFKRETAEIHTGITVFNLYAARSILVSELVG